jgi:hypothetical protein
MVTEEPYQKYPGLFSGLVKAIQNDDEASIELRLQAIRTTGLLGAVDETVYHEHLRNSGGVVDAFSSQSDHVEEEAEEESSTSSVADGEKIMTKIEKYYFTVVIRELMNILKDSNQSSHHQAASAIAVRVGFTFIYIYINICEYSNKPMNIHVNILYIYSCKYKYTYVYIYIHIYI